MSRDIVNRCLATSCALLVLPLVVPAWVEGAFAPPYPADHPGPQRVRGARNGEVEENGFRFRPARACE
jgi:hypothetical protein